MKFSILSAIFAMSVTAKQAVPTGELATCENLVISLYSGVGYLDIQCPNEGPNAGGFITLTGSKDSYNCTCPSGSECVPCLDRNSLTQSYRSQKSGGAGVAAASSFAAMVSGAIVMTML